jgi:hypothetical protein
MLVARQPRRSGAHGFQILGMTELEYRRSDEIARGISEHRRADRRGVDDGPRRRLTAQHVRRVVGEETISLLALAERDLGDLALRDVACDGEERGDLAVPLFDVNVLADPEVAPVGGEDRKFPVRDGDPLGDLSLVQGNALLVIIAPNELQIHVADDALVVGTAPHQPRYGWIRVQEDAVGVDPVDRVARALDQLMKARLALGERVLDLLALRDVPRGDREAVIHAHHLMADPANVAGIVLVSNLVLDRLSRLHDLDELLEQPSVTNRWQHLADRAIHDIGTTASEQQLGALIQLDDSKVDDLVRRSSQALA